MNQVDLNGYRKKRIIHFFITLDFFRYAPCVPCVQVFRMRGQDFPDLKLGIRDFKENSARFGIKSMVRGRDAKNNHRDYGTAPNFGSGLHN